MVLVQNRPAFRFGLAALLGCVAVCTASTAQEPVQRAQDAVARANQAETALEALAAEGNPEQQTEMAARAREVESALKEAREAYREAGFPEAASFQELRDYVALLRRTKDFDLAAAALEHAITRSPDDGLLRVELGECYAEIGPAKREAAFQTLREALNYELTDVYEARARFQLGQLYFEEGLYQFAREAFERVLELQPDAIRTKIALAALDAREGKVAQANDALEALGRAVQPYDIETRLMLRRALADFGEQRRHFDDTAENHYAYARLLYQAARIQDAIAAAEHSARRQPTTKVLNFLASMHMQLGNAGPARSAYERSLAIDPIQPGVRQSLATIPPNAQ